MGRYLSFLRGASFVNAVNSFGRGMFQCGLMRRRLRSVLFVSLACAASAFAGDNRWTNNGPFGGAITKIAYDTLDSSIAYASATAGLFRSTDGGRSWKTVPELTGIPIGDLAVASTNPQKVFASSTFGLYGSTDRGVTWRRLHGFASYKIGVSPDGITVYNFMSGGVARSTDGGVTFGAFGTGLPSNSSFSAIVVNPQTPATAYIAMTFNGAVYKTTDGGATWSQADSGLPASGFFSMILDPSNPSTIYAGGASSTIYKSTDAGASWTSVPMPVQNIAVYSLSISAAAPTVIYAGTSSGLLKSTTIGTSWNVQNTAANYPAVAVDPKSVVNVLASNIYDTVRSTDGGATFSVSNTGLAAFYASAIAADPNRHGAVFAAGPAGLWTSSDAGMTWKQSSSAATSAVIVDPFSSSTLYVIQGGVFKRSTDGGSTFSAFDAGLPSSPFRPIADPRTAGVLYALGGSGGRLPYQKVGANAWTLRASGLPASVTLLTLVIAQSNPSTLYAGGTQGLFRTNDGGGSWTLVNGDASSFANFASVAVDPFDANHLVTWSGTAPKDSTDGGVTWTPMSLPAGRQSIVLAFDPEAPGRIYLNSSDSVDRSDDGGKTWAQMTSGLGKLHGISLFAAAGNAVYLGDTNYGVWSYRFVRARAAAR